jgi:hypothetical protein
MNKTEDKLFTWVVLLFVLVIVLVILVNRKDLIYLINEAWK